ncbi:M23 family metallopeptidase [Kurthia massiliensis]|uniref:M23 family metallopeptidase n=1 Tax=Kurthia massiliensis TaxID=1033739 RepID=UPI00028A0BD5|nr:M23 family metallopeptidase [Kurthia massiliensis]
MKAILFQQGQFEALYGYFSPALRTQLPYENIRKPLKLFQLHMKDMHTRYLGDNQLQWRDDFGRYMIDLHVVQHEIVKFQMTSFIADRMTKNRYILPFENTWTVQQAEHYYTFKPVEKDASTPIIAPASGIVEYVSNDGVIIRHRGDEYSYIQHFTPTVAVGTKVRKRAFLGYIDTSETLKFQVLDTIPSIVYEVLPLQFQRFEALVKGDIVSNSHKSKLEKVEQGESLASLFIELGELLLYVPRLVLNFFK